jgi:catechol 2,3-dioxygenase-like lactoylglutathione lyase family enzyme
MFQTLLAVLFILSVPVLARAQTPSAAPPSELVLGPGNFLHVVADAERAIAFYRDALGMEVQAPAGGAPPAGPRPYLSTPEIVRLYNATGGRYRTATGLVQGSPMRAELVEWQDVDRKPFAPRHADPGAATMIVTVRDLAATLDRVKAAGGTVVSDGGVPVAIADERGAGLAVVVKDLDGFYVQLVQRDTMPITGAPSDRNAIDVGFSATVDDLDRALRIFNTVLGFSLTLDTEEHNDARLHMIGNFTAYYRRATGVVPGSNLQMELIEVQGVDRRIGRSRPQDPGTAILRLRVTDIDRAILALERQQVRVVSTGGEAVTLTGANATQRYAIVELPGNLFLQLVQVVGGR